MPTFAEVYQCLESSGPAKVVSSKGTEYTVEASNVNNAPAIIGRPASGRVVIHEDCWGNDETCQRTRAGGIYNGSFSINAA